MKDTLNLEKNWQFKSIESLEKKNYGPVPTDESSIVQRLWRLRKMPINELQVDDIRFMIIQGIGLKYLLVEAIDLLKENLLTEGIIMRATYLMPYFKLKKCNGDRLRSTGTVLML